MPTSPTNADRADRAAQIIKAYRGINSDMRDEEDDTCAMDIMSDLMHLLGDIAFEGALTVARVNYEAEIEEENDGN